MIELIKKNGFSAIPANKDVELGISKVAEYMKVNPITGKPQWVICNHLNDQIRQIENYQWEEVRGEDGKFKKQPKKEDDDAPDMLRYFMFSFFKVDVEYEKEAHNVINQRLQEEF